MKKQRKKFRKNSKRSDAGKKDNMSYRAISIRGDVPDTMNESERSVEIVVATEEPVEVFDFERYEVVKEVLIVEGAEMPKSRQVPLLDTHRRFDTANVLGSIRELKKEGAQLVGRAHFSSVADVDAIWTKVREGHLTDFSAGYRPIDSQWVPEGETYDFKGRSFKGPVRVTKRWRIREGSIVPIGADELAKARAATEGFNNANKNKTDRGGIEDMDKETEERIRTEERERVREITAMCRMYGCDDLADNKFSGVVNPFYKKLEPVVESYLDATSATGWYLAANPRMIDTVEIAFLGGNKKPYLDTREGWTVDGTEYKIRFEWAAKSIDWRGLYFNFGA